MKQILDEAKTTCEEKCERVCLFDERCENNWEDSDNNTGKGTDTGDHEPLPYVWPYKISYSYDFQSIFYKLI